MDKGSSPQTPAVTKQKMLILNIKKVKLNNRKQILTTFHTRIPQNPKY